MTDTIGWGDVAVEPRPRRRPPARLAWVLVTVVLVAFALVPYVRGHLAGNAEAALARDWATAKALDDARFRIAAGAVAHVGINDNATFAQLILALDREEVRRLSALASHVADRRTWAAHDTAAASVAVRRAIASRIRDLNRDAADVTPTIAAAAYLSTALSTDTQGLYQRADDAVAAADRHHHVGAVRARGVALTAATNYLRQLKRVTSVPVDARLLVARSGALDVVDLRTGTTRSDVASLPVDLAGPIPVIGAAALVSSDEQQMLVPIDGRKPVVLPHADFYLPSGGTGMWQVTGATVQWLDAAGHRRGPSYHLPAGMTQPLNATADALVVAVANGEPGAESFLWNPRTNQRWSLQPSCDGVVAPGLRSLAYFSCDGARILVLDETTGQTRTLRAPSGLTAVDGSAALSPDGRRLAVQVSPDGAAGGSPDAFRLAVYDVATGVPTVIDTPAGPVAWSPDSSTLLVTTASSANLTGFLPLGYWQPGMTSAAAIRVDVPPSPNGLALIGP